MNRWGRFSKDDLHPKSWPLLIIILWAIDNLLHLLDFATLKSNTAYKTVRLGPQGLCLLGQICDLVTASG